MKIELSPIVLESNVSEFEKILRNCLTFSNQVNIDFVDWSRTPNKTINVEQVAKVLEGISQKFSIDFDLMMDDPEPCIERLLNFPHTRFIAINLESKKDVMNMIDFANSTGEIKAGISVNPENEFTDYYKYLDKVNWVNILTIVPGKQGNPFLPEMLNKADELRENGFKGHISIDGGVNIDTIDEILKHPFDLITAGSGIVKQENPEKAYRELLEIIHVSTHPSLRYGVQAGST